MPSADRRGTYRSRYEPDYSDYDSYSDSDSPYPTERRPRPRRKSTTRSIVDRVSRSISRLNINRSPSRSRHQSPVRHQHSYTRNRSADASYPPSPARPRPRNTRHSSSYSLSPPATHSHSLSPGPDPDRRWKHAARSALDAAVVEAMRVRKEPGKWTGGKGARVATAALGAAAVDALVAKDPDRHGKRKSVEAAIGGLLLNRVVNGPRRELRKEGRSRR